MTIKMTFKALFIYHPPEIMLSKEGTFFFKQLCCLNNAVVKMKTKNHPAHEFNENTVCLLQSTPIKHPRPFLMANDQ